MKSFVKELFIGVLLLMVVVFTLGILFYDSMPNNKATPTSITYTADTAVTTTIQQISEEKANSTSSNSSSSSDSSGLDIGSVIASYSIGSTDLSTYAQRKTYESGKVDPFDDYKEETNADNGNTTGDNNNSTGNNNNNSGSNSNNGTGSSSKNDSSNSSTGKLFENKNSK